MDQEEKNAVLERHYWCFISYRHTDNRDEGRQWASWLHQQLETYEVPADLIGTRNERGEDIPSRIFPVFRDEEELAVGSSLTDKIFRALDNSKLLVVLCSPRAVDSPYVREEIRYFKKIGKAGQIYAALLEGEPEASFPATLRCRVDAEGNVVPNEIEEPLAANFRLADGSQGWTSPAAYAQELRRDQSLAKAEVDRKVADYLKHLEHAKLQLIAGVLGVPLDLLRKRDKAHQLALAQKRARNLRRWLGVVASMFVLAVIGGVLSVWRTIDSNRQRDAAWSNEAHGWMLQADVAEERGKQYPSTLLYAARAIGFDGVGREEKTGKTFLDQVKDWVPFLDEKDETPRLWTSWRNKADYDRARQWIRDHANYLPVWSSPLCDSPVTSLALSPEGRYLVISAQDGSVRLWDFSTGEETKVSGASGKPVAALAFDPNGKDLAVAEEEGIRLWNLESTAFVGAHPSSVAALAYSPSGQILAGAEKDGSIVLWTDKGQTLLKTNQSVPATRLTFNPDDSALAAVYPGVGLRLFFHGYGEPHLSWAKDAEAVTSWVKGAGEMTAMAFSPDGVRLGIGSTKGSISLWEVASARMLGEIVPQQRHAGAVLGLSFRYDGKQLASASADGTIKVWKVESDVPDIVATLVGHKGSVGQVDYAPDGMLLASAGADGSAKLWDVSGRKGAALNLYPYLTENWYAFEKDSQRAGWKSGSGFLNVPKDSVVGIWREKESGKLFTSFMKTGNWIGAALMANDGDRAELVKAIVADADKAVDGFQFNRARMRMAQLNDLGVRSDLEELQARIGKVAVEDSNFINGDGMEMIWCPAGTFVMGSPDSEEGHASHENQHQVTLTRGFWIGKYEVSQSHFQDLMGVNTSTHVSAGPNAPAENMSWHEARELCRRLTDRERARGMIPQGWEYDLPTEAQWEYACRAGTATAFNFGDDGSMFYLHGNYNDVSGKFAEDYDEKHDDKHKLTAPVGSYLPNPWQLHDMHGNVMEWCRDAIDPENPYLRERPATDPLVEVGLARVVKGGTFDDPIVRCRSARRGAAIPSSRNSELGLRPALVPSRQPAAVP